MEKRLIAELPTEQGKTIEIELFYELGGVNQATGRLRSRGYYLSVAPVAVEPSESNPNIKLKRYRAFSGVVHKVKDARRFSPRIMQEYFPDRILIKTLVQRVLDMNELTLKEQKHGNIT